MNGYTAEKVLENLYFNQRMFTKAERSSFNYINEHNDMMVEKYSKDISFLIDYMDGKIKFEDLPWDVRLSFCDIPEDFTKGT